MQKTFIAVAITMIILLFGFLFSRYYQKNVAATMKINTPNGTVEVNNVYKKEEEKLSQGNVGLKRKTDEYTIDYYPEFKEFNIAILNIDEPNAGRTKAENDLVQTLGISHEEACKLNVRLGVPYNINPDLSGINYGLSFCPNGLPFYSKNPK